MEEPLNPLTYPTYPTTSSCEAACTSVVSFCVQELSTEPFAEGSSTVFVCQLNSVLFALVISAAVALGIVIPLSFVILYVVGCFSTTRRRWKGASEELKAINTNTKIQVPSDNSDSFPVKKGSMMVGDGRQKQLQWHESVSVS